MKERILTFYFNKKQVVLKEGDASLGCYFVKNGKLKVVRKGQQGKEVLIKFVMPGDFLGHVLGGTKMVPNPFSVICLEECTLCYLPYKLVEEVMTENPILTKSIAGT